MGFINQLITGGHHPVTREWRFSVHETLVLCGTQQGLVTLGDSPRTISSIATFTLRQRRWKLPIPNPALVSSLRCYRLLQWIQVSNEENEQKLGTIEYREGTTKPLN
jgi:hypothetical protein